MAYAFRARDNVTRRPSRVSSFSETEETYVPCEVAIWLPMSFPVKTAITGIFVTSGERLVASSRADDFSLAMKRARSVALGHAGSRGRMDGQTQQSETDVTDGRRQSSIKIA